MSTKKSLSNKEKFDHPEMGERIKLIRVSANMNQSDFADKMGTTQSTIAKYEKGMMLPADILFRLSDFSNKSVYWIRSGVEEQAIQYQLQALPLDERDLLKAYRQLDESDKGCALRMVLGLRGLEEKSEINDMQESSCRAVNFG